MSTWIVTDCLKYALNSHKNQFTLTDVYKSLNVTIADDAKYKNDLKELEGISSLFKIQDNVVEIHFKLPICKDYNRKKGKCLFIDYYLCQSLHICEHQLSQYGCIRDVYGSICQLEHSFETTHNMKILTEAKLQNIDTNLLMLVAKQYLVEIKIKKDAAQKFSTKTRDGLCQNTANSESKINSLSQNNQESRSEAMATIKKGSNNKKRQDNVENSKPNLTTNENPLNSSKVSLVSNTEIHNESNEKIKKNKRSKSKKNLGSKVNNKPTTSDINESLNKEELNVGNNDDTTIKTNELPKEPKECQTSNRTIEIELTDEFCDNVNMNLLFVILTTEEISGGGAADKSSYECLMYQKKVFLTYNDESVAQRIVDKGVVKFSKYELKVKYKQEGIKQEAVKQEAVKQEAVKKEAQKQEALKQEAVKQEAVKQEAQKQEAQKQEAQKQEALRQEAQKQEALKQEAQKQEALRQEAQKQEALKQEALKQEAQKQEAQKQEAQKQEALKQEALKQEAQKQEALKQEAQKQEALKQEALKQEAQKQEALKQEALKQEALKQEALKQEALKQEALKQEALKQEALKQEALKQESGFVEPIYDKTKLLFQNVPSSLTQEDIETYATKLTDVPVETVLRGEELTDCLLVSFNTEINFQFASKRHRDFQKNTTKKFKIDRISFTNKVKMYLTTATNTKITQQFIEKSLLSIKSCITKIHIDQTNNYGIVEFNSPSVATTVSRLKLDSIGFELYYECMSKKNNTGTDVKNEVLKPNDIIKTLQNNVFFRIIFNKNNVDWISNFTNTLKSVHANVEMNDSEIIISCTLEENNENYYSLAKSWFNTVNSVISNFVKDFKIISLRFDDNNSLSSIISRITDFNTKLKHNVAYEVDTENKFVYLVEKDDIIALFMMHQTEHETLAHLKVNDKNEESEKIREIKIPKFKNTSFFNILNDLVLKTKEKFKLTALTFNGKDKKIYLKSELSVYTEVSSFLNGTISNISYRKLNNIDAKFINLKAFHTILEDALKSTNYLCKFDLVTRKKDTPSVYLIYFRNCPLIDSPEEYTYNEIEKWVNEYFHSYHLYLSEFVEVLATNKWKDFETKTLNNKAQRKSFSYTIDNKTNTLLAFGKKDIATSIRSKVVAFLSENQCCTYKLSYTQDEIIFFKHIAYEIKKDIETKYEEKNLKIEYNSVIKNTNEFGDSKHLEMYLTNCSSKDYLDVVGVLNNVLLKKKTDTFEVGGLPGLRRVLMKTNLLFKESLSSLEREMKVSIDYDVTKSIATTSDTNKATDEILIFNNRLKIIKGDIINFKGDVIVNSTIHTLKLNSAGPISRTIHTEAGDTIQKECDQKYPNGIDYTTIGITSAGNLRNIRHIYHVCVYAYEDKYKAERLKELKTVIANCLHKMKNNKLKTICFPSIGVGNLSYPAELAAKIALEECVEFLVKSQNEKFDVNFCLFEDSTYKIYLSQLELFKKDVNKSVTSSQEYTATFKVISDDEKVVTSVKDKIINLIKSQLHSETMSYDSLNNITSLIVTPDVEIQRVSDTEITIVGFKDDVIATKAQIKDMLISINEKLNNDYKKLMKGSNSTINVKWEYREHSNEWRPFNLFMNNKVEVAYLKNEKTTIITNEDGDVVEVDFNRSNYRKDNKVFSIRRTEMTSQVKYPSDWEPMSSDYDMFVIRSYTHEYKFVFCDFVSKLGFKPKLCHIERIQNERLYKQYLVHKDYLKRKNGGNENEKCLFHGAKKGNFEAISKYGFNRSYCDTNGTKYGQGVYFAVNSSYSDTYANDPSDMMRRMFYCLVLVGESTYGYPSTKVPPMKPNNELYDSTCDPQKTVFVVYNDSQCYPHYLISYVP